MAMPKKLLNSTRVWTCVSIIKLVPSLPVLKAFVFLLCQLPLAWLFYLGWQQQLGPDPGQFVVESLGHDAIRLLLITLALSSIARLSGQLVWLRFRRMVGLFSFFYAALHILAFLGFILVWDWAQIGQEIIERPYITMGMAAFLCMLPLAITSNRPAMRALGRRWQRLHRLVYPALVLVLIHVAWQLRADLGIWVWYFAAAILLLLERLLRPGVLAKIRPTA